MTRSRQIITILVSVLALLATACSSPPTPTPTQFAGPTKPVATAVSGPAVTTPGAAATATSGGADLETGKTVFASNCNVCHPNAGKGAGPEIKGKTPDVVSATVRSGRGAMPAFGPDKVSDAQLAALAAYVASLK